MLLRGSLLKFAYRIFRAPGAREGQLLLAEGETVHLVCDASMQKCMMPERYAAPIRSAIRINGRSRGHSSPYLTHGILRSVTRQCNRSTPFRSVVVAEAHEEDVVVDIEVNVHLHTPALHGQELTRRGRDEQVGQQQAGPAAIHVGKVCLAGELVDPLHLNIIDA